MRASLCADGLTPPSFQVSQHTRPLASHGFLDVALPVDGGGGSLRVGVTRAHVEEDSGKLVHCGADSLSGATHSLADYNRAGTPLVEVVSEPDMRSGREAAAYAAELQRLVRFLGVSDGNMEEGSMRVDVNVSVRDAGRGAPFGTKVEVKNLNSFAAMSRAVDFEAARQAAVLDAGGVVAQETRMWDDGAQKTVSMRTKEGQADYRFLPEPDLQPLVVMTSSMIDSALLPELPAQVRSPVRSLRWFVTHVRFADPGAVRQTGVIASGASVFGQIGLA